MDPYDNPAHQAEQRALNLGPAMLPTPAKTPRKQDQRKATELQSAARVLFPARHEKVEDAMPRTKGRKGRKNVGFSLDSSGEEENIQIFTDSKDKVPELDVGDHNPFLDNPNRTESPENHESPGRKGRKSRTQVKEHPQIKDAFHHEKGMVYVFRGKKIYQSFAADPENPNLSSEETEIEDHTSRRLRPTTRASVKPRLLFPTERQRRQREQREKEALDDTEDGHANRTKEAPITPVKQSFAPATPPPTGHVTRSATKKAAAETSLLGSSATGIMAETRSRKKTSPFDEWQRTKSGSGAHSKGRKRAAEHMETDSINPGSKRTKAQTALV
ncbi:MAG: hypothetical protein Q9183_000492 [Haloplaca sp. 2 TL-2023]